MLSHTHMAFAFLTGIIFLSYINIPNPALWILVLIIASLFPDVDHTGSRLGRKVKIIGWLFEHRGFFHSVFGAAFFTILFHISFGRKIYTAAFLLGYLSHILLDAITDSGVMLLHPLSKKRMKGFMRTGAFYEHVVFLLFLAAGFIKLLNIH